MKKHLLIALGLVVAGLGATAQVYNKTYSQPSPDFRAVDFVNANNNGESVMLSRNRFYGSGTDKELVLTKFNATGGIIDQKWWDLDLGATTMKADKLVQTPDRGYLVVGRLVVSGDPFVAKFDMNLNFQWARLYAYASGTWNQGRNPKVLITKISSSPTDYLIVTNSSPIRGNSGDASILAIRINGMSGTPVWGFKYEIPWSIRNVAPQDYYLSLNNRPYALANGVGISFIAGELDYSAYYTLGYAGFYLALDDNTGNLNTQYNIMDTYAPANHHAIYDDMANGSANPPSSAFILSYTAGLTGGLRQVALQKFSIGATVTPGVLDYYYETGIQEIYPQGLARKLGDDYYTVSVWRRPNEMLGVGALGMMTVNKNRNAGVFNAYNEMTTSFNEATPPVSLVSAGVEKNVMIGRKAKGIRVISADLNLDACGSSPKTPQRTPMTPSFIQLPYAKHEPSGFMYGINFTPGSIFQGESDCASLPPSDWPFYRVSPLEQSVEAGEVNVYPTLIKDGERSVKLDVASVQATALDVSLVSIDGKVIVRKSFALATGQQTISLDIPELTPGTYIIDARSADGKINHRARASKI